jgi:hypothetical protein
LNGFSGTFTLSPAGEWQQGVDRIKRMDEAGELGAWFAKKEQERKRSGGQTINVYAVKPMGGAGTKGTNGHGMTNGAGMESLGA